MQLSYINLSQICSVECSFVRINTKYKYREARPRMGIFKPAKKEGFVFKLYDGATTYYMADDKILDDEELFIKDKNVYFRPSIVITMSNNKKHSIYFGSNIEMIECLSKELLDNPKIDFLQTKRVPESRNVLLEKYNGYSDNLRIILKLGLNTDKEIL